MEADGGVDRLLANKIEDAWVLVRQKVGVQSGGKERTRRLYPLERLLGATHVHLKTRKGRGMHVGTVSAGLASVTATSTS